MSERPKILREIKGLPLTPRMKAMGVTGMISEDDGWRATFANYPGVTFLIPQPIVDWLLIDAALGEG